MKKMKMLPAALLAFFVSLNFISCDTEPVDPVFLDNIEDQVPDTGSGSFQVNIDGELFTATQTQAVIGEGLIAIQGSGSNGKNVSLVLEGEAAPSSIGEYEPSDVLMIYQPETNPDDYGYINYNPDLVIGGEIPDDIYEGSFTITDIDTVNKTISGTFSFTGYWSNTDDEIESVELTSGVFTDVSYADNTTNPNPGSDEDYIVADIDGTETDFTIAVALVSGNFLTVSGQNVAPPKQIQLMMDADIEAGTYSITEDGGFGNGVTAMYSEGLALYVVSSGELTIISNDGDVIKGTFEFSAYNSDDENDTIDITNGDFEMQIP
ncbi:hypothetical protein GCM10007424_06020 [Flavobacterium suaedae]|uniref:Uncharacterized protein n=1 Tax=Flavobacterium suaedae TaxID=1767027 RepID=A0ABQ1JKU5_9FLAO|nr:DUF6252 family protein [Flavobacterium suaedae]GGB68804.1 hypothetical protein GCM10007424_06020 [Flavobacterium suaedae]